MSEEAIRRKRRRLIFLIPLLFSLFFFLFFFFLFVVGQRRFPCNLCSDSTSLLLPERCIEEGHPLSSQIQRVERPNKGRGGEGEERGEKTDWRGGEGRRGLLMNN